jgi:dihydrofolate reductase
LAITSAIARHTLRSVSRTDTGWAAKGSGGGRPFLGVAVSSSVDRDDTTQGERTVGKIIISTNASLDGVVQDPTGEEGFDRGGWFVGDDLGAWSKVSFEEALAAEALLLGRQTDAWFASRWLSRPGEFADRLNNMPKYVVSSTLAQVKWGKGTVLNGDLVEQVTKVRQDTEGDILLYASYRLGQTLIEHDLVDEVRLTVFPVVLGAGRRMFGETSGSKPWRLGNVRTIGDSLVHLTYRQG